MARPRSRPAPPRASDPDLPRHLEHAILSRHADLVGSSITVGAGPVDGAHARVSESVVGPGTPDRLDLTGAVLADVALIDLATAEFRSGDGSWRTVTLNGGRIGTLDAQRARWDGVILRGIRIDYLSVPAATLRDVLIVDCRIGTLDAPGAVLERVGFIDTTVDEFDTRALSSTDLDLRGLEALAFTDIRALAGATASRRQVEAHAPAFAAALGWDVRDEASAPESNR
ncbi:hypothetical protein C1N74_08120 [Microbacterium sp. SGAir0570]|uniref:hypothetical protein n=1 Tax=Microbacterium sp. SGAir0570 TaxID=2070348 RepID=UPI0010CCD2BB|nr:hypothetical protein [Microbacterium sp. SGAir0570]QCR40386.1 hypothetical protein C1N74_08120 [Microbacterium sp. SGAir0570]